MIFFNFAVLSDGGFLKSLIFLTAEAAETLRKVRRVHNRSAILFVYFARNFAPFAVK
jgi:hypothetical protein